jgi:hypothetical protein
MKEFARAILSKQGEKLTCSECKAQLAEYVETQVMGSEPGEDLAGIGLHLQVCPHCAQEYRELLVLVTSAYTEKLPQPAHQPKFDFAFLVSSPIETLETQPAKPFRWDEPGRLIIEFSAGLLRGLQPPALQPAYAGVKSEKPRRTLCQLVVKEAAADPSTGSGQALEVTITAEEIRDDPTRCTVVVEVNIPSRGGWPNLAGTQVTLKHGEQALETQATDAFGKAVFEGISVDDLAHLTFEIAPVVG